MVISFSKIIKSFSDTQPFQDETKIKIKDKIQKENNTMIKVSYAKANFIRSVDNLLRNKFDPIDIRSN